VDAFPLSRLEAFVVRRLALDQPPAAKPNGAYRLTRRYPQHLIDVKRGAQQLF